MTVPTDHSEVARCVAEALDEEIDFQEVVDYSESDDRSNQWVDTRAPPGATELLVVLEETNCAVTNYSHVRNNPRTWFGLVRIDLDGPTFVDRERPA